MSSPRRDQLTECPSPEELQALVRATDDAASLVAWAMLCAGVRQRDGRWYTKWKRGKHLYLIAELLVGLFHGERRRLALTCPPRHGKSMMVSQVYPTWAIGKDPDARVVVCSYSQTAAKRSTAIAKDFLGREGPACFGLTTVDRAAAHDWRAIDVATQKPRRGGMRAVGRCGPLTGDDVDHLLADDLYKDYEEANSETIRQSALDWWQTVPETRMEPWTKALAMFTRWHNGDIIGYLQDQQEKGLVAVPWEFVTIPAVCDSDDDPLGRAPGEPLWAERFGREYYEELQRGTPPRDWQAMYQGRPTALGGDMFKSDWLRYFVEEGDFLVTEQGRVAKQHLAVFATVDLAFSTKTSADYSVCCVWGGHVATGTLYLLHLERDRKTADELGLWLRGVFATWGVKRAFVERSGFYADITQHLILTERLPLREVQPNADKVSRAQPAAALMASGGIVFRQGAEWLGALEQELAAFPNGVHDDQVDALSLGVNAFRGGLRPDNVASRKYARRQGGGDWTIGRR